MCLSNITTNMKIIIIKKININYYVRINWLQRKFYKQIKNELDYIGNIVKYKKINYVYINIVYKYIYKILHLLKAIGLVLKH